MDGLSRLVSKAVSYGIYKGFHFDGNVFVSHLFFVDDLLLFTDGSRRDVLLFKSSLRIFCLASGMIYNSLKSSMSFMNLDLGEVSWHSDNFHFIPVNVAMELKYLGYIIKPNDYSIKDWS